MFEKMFASRPATFALAIALMATSATAETAISEQTKQGLTGTVNQFYAAISEPVNDIAVAFKMAEDAQIELRDLDIEQTGAEFVESLSEWANVIEGGTIEHEIASLESAVYVVNVCYRFAAGDPYGTVETMTFTDDGRIASMVQEARAESCDE
ncbi:MAG: hypothetical protein AAF737_03120 [Pseudomonadota bacterium]